MSLFASLNAAIAASPAPPPTPREGGNSGAVFMIQILAMLVILYFLLIRPQQKQRKQHQEMIKKLGKGDNVVTSGGIIGVIVHATEQALTIRTAENTRIVVDRGHIGRKIEEE